MCGLNQVDIQLNSVAGYCPAGRFRLGLGDFLARFFHMTGIRWIAAELARERSLYADWMRPDVAASSAVGSSGCGGCTGRQLVLNAIAPARSKEGSTGS